MPGGMMGVSDHYVQHGWVPDRVGLAVQWSFEDWALAQMAADLGPVRADPVSRGVTEIA